MKLLIFLAVWKRPEITEICFMGIQRLQKVPGFQISAFAVISEAEMIPLCEKYGVDWCMAANHPLGAKKNYGVRQAFRNDFDYMIEIGSDDLLKNEVLEAYQWDAPVLGLLEFVLIDTKSGRSKFITTKIPKFGAGRAINREALERGDLWPEGRNRGMDNSSSMKLGLDGFLQRGVKWKFPLAICLKSDVGLWSYNSMPGRKYSLDKALEGLSIEEVTAIKSLQYATV